MNYEVKSTDTIEGIAAAHDCTVGELVKLNRMHSRVIFVGQKLQVPMLKREELYQSTDKIQKNVDSDPSSKNFKSTQRKKDRYTENILNEDTGLKRENQTNVFHISNSLHQNSSSLTNLSHQKSFDAFTNHLSTEYNLFYNNFKTHALTKTQSVSNVLLKRNNIERSKTLIEDNDEDCLQKFLKIKVKQVTESDGTVTGTLLITPNCLMFDPDPHHILVEENGTDLYGMVANMEDIVSIGVYKQFENLTGAVENRKTETFDPEQASKNAENILQLTQKLSQKKNLFDDEKILSNNENLQNNNSKKNELLNNDLNTISVVISNQFLPLIEEEAQKKNTFLKNDKLNANQKQVELILQCDNSKQEKNLCISDCCLNKKLEKNNGLFEIAASTSLDLNSVANQPNRRSPSPSSHFSQYSPNITRRSFGKLGQTLSARANSLKGTVTCGAQSVASSTQKVAHEVVSHTRSAADHIQTGIQASAKAVASVPGSIANAVHDKQTNMINNKQEQNLQTIKRKKSLATLESLRQKTHQARQFSLAENKNNNKTSNFIGTPPDPPYYMVVRVNRRQTEQKEYLSRKNLKTEVYTNLFENKVHAFGNRRKREFWFAVPRVCVNSIYQFLLHWSSSKHGQEEVNLINNTNHLDAVNQTSNIDNNILHLDNNQKQNNHFDQNRQGFIVLDSLVDDFSTGKKPLPQLIKGASNINFNREWEVVTVQELRRRLSLEDLIDISDMPIPEGSSQSKILDEFMIKQIVDILPPRAEGYPWISIYNSEKHGFSLSTFYRKMSNWDEEMSPILLVIRDTKNHIFGAVASSALKPAEHYYGTGDSCILFKFTGEFPHTRELKSYSWTGENQFFINATRDFLSMGGGGGHYGLWLDADLYHGCSQKCATFDNESLVENSDNLNDKDGDFVVQFIEAFGFKMS